MISNEGNAALLRSLEKPKKIPQHLEHYKQQYGEHVAGLIEAFGELFKTRRAILFDDAMGTLIRKNKLDSNEFYHGKTYLNIPNETSPLFNVFNLILAAHNKKPEFVQKEASKILTKIKKENRKKVFGGYKESQYKSELKYLEELIKPLAKNPEPLIQAIRETKRSSIITEKYGKRNRVFPMHDPGEYK